MSDTPDADVADDAKINVSIEIIQYVLEFFHPGILRESYKILVNSNAKEGCSRHSAKNVLGTMK